jgi:hypothetical protein
MGRDDLMTIFTTLHSAVDTAEQDTAAEIARLQAEIDRLTKALADCEGATPPPPEPPPTPQPGTWTNRPAKSTFSLAGKTWTVEAPPRADAFRLSSNGWLDANVRQGEVADTGRGRSEARTAYDSNTVRHIEYTVTLGASDAEYNIHGQAHPNNNTDNPSWSFNYEDGNLILSSSTGTQASIIERARFIGLYPTDEVRIKLDMKFGGSGYLKGSMTRGSVSVAFDRQNIPVGKDGQQWNFKLGTYRQTARSNYACVYRDIVIT